jgi:predicted naringenin-chalcone synthase
MAKAYLNRVATAVPAHDVHRAFVDYVPSMLGSERDRTMFQHMVHRAQIAYRYSFLKPSSTPSSLDGDDFYRPGDFPGTATRMQFYKEHAFSLVRDAIDQLDIERDRDAITHVIVTSCTGLYAPGIDWQIIDHYGLNPSVERTMVAFMGCQAAINALRVARHIVRSEPKAKVLVVNIELCTLHMQETANLEQVLSFLIFADGCAASIISAEATGIELESFYSALIADSSEYITWHIGALGFDMVLAREVPGSIASGLPPALPAILNGRTPADIEYWAVHPGGRSILDAVRSGIGLEEDALAISRSVLHDYGNMSSATIMFVLQRLLAQKPEAGPGCALSFGPGLTAETMRFSVV